MPAPNTTEDIFARLDARGACWEWTGHRTHDGYGQATYGGKKWMSHRLLYTLLVSEIPEGMQLDHLCRNRACANPDHVELVTGSENTRRGHHQGAITLPTNSGIRESAKTHCPQGHPYSGDNVHIDRAGARRCRECDRIRARRNRAARGHAHL